VFCVFAPAVRGGRGVARPRPGRAPPPPVRARVAAFTSPAASGSNEHSAAPVEMGVPGPVERSLEGTRWWATLEEALEIARIDRPAIRIVYLTAAGAVLGALVLGTLAGTPLVAVLTLAAVPLAVRATIRQRLRHQRALFVDQLPSHLQETAAAMRAGNSIVGALASVAQGASEPTRSEFQRVIADERLGVPLEDALRIVAHRMASDDMDQVALVAALHQRTGGNMAEVFDRVAEGLRERAELRRDLVALTAQARLSRWVVTALPPALLAVIWVLNPEYTRPLFHTGIGRILLAVAAGMVVAGSFVIKRIVEIEI
jgi:tight adherence protein B